MEDIQKQINWSQKQTWTKKQWIPKPSLIKKVDGIETRYSGQSYDPRKEELIEDGWPHDHYSICFFTISDTDEIESNSGWTDPKGNWLRSECYDLFITNI